MRVIEQEKWPRKAHFDIFSRLDHPHISLSVNVDITDLWNKRARLDASLTTGLVYVIAKAANLVPELRQRIRGDQVVEHDVIHPLIPILSDDGMFSPCPLSFNACFRSFAADAEVRVAEAKENVSLDGWLYDEDGALRPG